MIKLLFPIVGSKRRMTIRPIFSLTAKFFVVRTLTVLCCLWTCLVASGTGITAGLTALGTTTTLRRSARKLVLRTRSFRSFESFEFSSRPRVFERGVFFMLKLSAAVGEYAGDYGFPLPNPVSIHREYPQLRFWIEWCMKTLQKMKLLGVKC